MNETICLNKEDESDTPVICPQEVRDTLASYLHRLARKVAKAHKQKIWFKTHDTKQEDPPYAVRRTIEIVIEPKE